MAKAISYNAKTKTQKTHDIEFNICEKTNKELKQEYKQKVVELIALKYSIYDEIKLNADNQLSIIENKKPNQEWIDYRKYVQTCKDRARAESF